MPSPDEKEVIQAAAQGTAKGVTDSLLAPLKEVVTPFCKEVGEGLGYVGRVIKLDLALRMAKRARKMLEDVEVEPQRVPTKLFLPIMENAGVEEDESLQERWAALLANAADPRRSSPVPVSFSTILRDLEAHEALFLDSLFNSVSGPRSNGYRADGVEIGDEQKLISIYDQIAGRPSGPDLRAASERRWVEFWQAVNNLIRLGLLAREPASPEKPPPLQIPSNRSQKLVAALYAQYGALASGRHSFSVTRLGLEFVKCCRQPREDH
jgi:hypothetical protein